MIFQLFTRSVGQHGAPETITPDGDPATHSAVAELKKSGTLRLETKVRASEYLNNLVEQDHRRVKQRLYPMLGFKSFRHAAETVSGVELARQSRKGRYDTPALTVREEAVVPHAREAVLSAWGQSCEYPRAPSLLFAPAPRGLSLTNLLTRCFKSDT